MTTRFRDSREATARCGLVAVGGVETGGVWSGADGAPAGRTGWTAPLEPGAAA